MKTCPGCALSYPDESTFCFLDGQTLQAYEDDLLGSTVAGRFRLLEVLGEGACGRVYRARHRLITRPCVVKVFRLPDQDARDRFAERSVLARRCSHPNVAPLLAAAPLANGAAFSARLATDAQPLSLLLARTRLDASQAVGLILQVLAALGRIHDFGAIHGSLRPSNCLYSSNGHVDVVDVGLGRALVCDPWDEAPESLNAQHYLAPELNSKQRASVAADLYAVGVMAFEMLAGERPFRAATVAALRAQLSADEPVAWTERLAGVPAPIASWVGLMLSRFPQQRPVDAHHARAQLLDACREAEVAPMVDPGRPEDGAGGELDPALARWERYGRIFGTMLDIGFPGGAPEQARASFQAIRTRVERLGEIGKRASFEHDNLDEVFARALEGRERIAAQMDELNAKAQQIRATMAPILSEAEAHGERCQQFPPRALERHREVLQWEGRSGFAEPYRQLSAAYRELADEIDRWLEVRERQLECERQADAKRDELAGVEAELDELRAALRVHESNVGEEIDLCETALAELGREADKLEQELLDLSSRFTAPLRSKPELGRSFRELLEA